MLKYSSKSKQEILAISSLITRQFGRLHFNVSDAALSNSIKPIVSNPASSIPKASPPAPAKSSIVEKNFCLTDLESSVNSIISPILHCKAIQIFSILSKETVSFLPIRAITLKLTPDDSFNSVLFILRSISSFQRLL